MTTITEAPPTEPPPADDPAAIAAVYWAGYENGRAAVERPAAATTTTTPPADDPSAAAVYWRRAGCENAAEAVELLDRTDITPCPVAWCDQAGRHPWTHDHDGARAARDHTH